MKTTETDSFLEHIDKLLQELQEEEADKKRRKIVKARKRKIDQVINSPDQK